LRASRRGTLESAPTPRPLLVSGDGPNASPGRGCRRGGRFRNTCAVNSANSIAVDEGSSSAPAVETGQPKSYVSFGVPTARNNASRAFGLARPQLSSASKNARLVMADSALLTRAEASSLLRLKISTLRARILHRRNSLCEVFPARLPRRRYHRNHRRSCVVFLRLPRWGAISSIP